MLALLAFLLTLFSCQALGQGKTVMNRQLWTQEECKVLMDNLIDRYELRLVVYMQE